MGWNGKSGLVGSLNGESFLKTALKCMSLVLGLTKIISLYFAFKQFFFHMKFQTLNKLL